jgi:transcriptional regulator with XRE-family HTH domain
MTKAQLASSAELPRAPMTRYEGKQNKDMSAKTVKKLAYALGVSADYLAGRREDQVYFKNPRLQKLIKNMRDLERKDLQCLHKMYLFILENHQPQSKKSTS